MNQQKISIIGIDNSPESLIGGMSSYDFEMEEAVEQIGTFILGAERGQRPTPYAELPGMVIHRESVRRTGE